MPLSLSEILSNKKVVVFSFGEDTITLTYKPYAMQGTIYKRFQRLAKRADIQKPEKLIPRLLWHVRHYSKPKVYRLFLQTVIEQWDLTENGQAVSVKQGLKRLPARFVNMLYLQVVNEIITVTRETINEPLKKKSSAG